MRMLSSTTADLRYMATELRMFAKAMNAPFILPETKECTRISMRNAAVELEHAADTIDELRNTCNDLQAENKKLQESYDNLRNATWDKAHAHAIQHMEDDELRATCADLCDYVDELKALVRDMWRDVPKTESCGWDNTANCCTGSDECRGECALWHRMRDLGIEVE